MLANLLKMARLVRSRSTWSFDINGRSIFILEIVDAAKRTGAVVKGPVPLPTRVQRFDVLRPRT
jgi:ribosomal protein S10